MTRRFPYAVYFVVEESRVSVLRVLHHARDPREWRRSIDCGGGTPTLRAQPREVPAAARIASPTGRRRLPLKFTRIRKWRRLHVLDDQLADFDSWEEADRIFGEVDHLERDRSFESGMDRRRGEMNEKSDARKGTASLDTRGKTRPAFTNWEMDAFERLSEDERRGAGSLNKCRKGRWPARQSAGAEQARVR